MTAAPRALAKLKIDVLVDSDCWKEPAKVRSIVRRAVGQAAATLSTTGTELAIVLTDDSAIRQLNRLWRGIDKATNVLSFPTQRKTMDEPAHLGDIVLAYETIDREAHAEDKPFAHHVAHLAVHGFLHLVGYDHEEAAAAETMEQTERNILARLNIPDPYRHPAKTVNRAVKSARSRR
jgi:probable rRNA maturation factor